MTCDCVHLCVCAGIDYKQRNLEIDGKQLRLSIWYVSVCVCMCVCRQRERVIELGAPFKGVYLHI